jgi:hypothetical protein
MEKRNMFVGLDVHKDTIDASIAQGDRRGEVRHYGVIASDLEPLDKVVSAAGAGSAPPSSGWGSFGEPVARWISRLHSVLSLANIAFGQKEIVAVRAAAADTDGRGCGFRAAAALRPAGAARHPRWK